MLQGVANKIRDVQILGIPFGDGVVGFGAALVVAERTDGLITPRMPSNVPVVAIKVGEAYAMSRWGHKVIGSGGARVAAIVLGYDALRTVVPIDTWIKEATAKLFNNGVLTTTTAPGGTYTPPAAGGVDAMNNMRSMLVLASNGGAQ